MAILNYFLQRAIALARYLQYSSLAKGAANNRQLTKGYRMNRDTIRELYSQFESRFGEEIGGIERFARFICLPYATTARIIRIGRKLASR